MHNKTTELASIFNIILILFERILYKHANKNFHHI